MVGEICIGRQTYAIDVPDIDPFRIRADLTVLCVFDLIYVSVIDLGEFDISKILLPLFL